MSGEPCVPGVVIIAGAGASHHLGYPVGRRFTAKVKKAIKAKAGPACGYWTRYLKGKHGVDFEVMLEHCSRLAGSHQLDTRKVDLEVCRGCDDLEGAEALAELIRGELVQAFSPRPSASKMDASPWPELLSKVGDLTGTAGNPTPTFLFTTNYDTAFTWLEHHLYDKGVQVLGGFKPTEGRQTWHRENLDESINAAAQQGGRRPVVHMPLHGSVTWEKVGDRVIDHVDIHGRPLLQTARKALIWPAVNKLPFGDPFWAHHEQLVVGLREAPLILFIGYGFWDDAIMALIKLALRHPKEERKIVVWDRGCDALQRAYKRGCLQEDAVEPIETDFTAAGVPKALQALGMRAPAVPTIAAPRPAPSPPVDGVTRPSSSGPPPTLVVLPPNQAVRHEQEATQLALGVKQHLSGPSASPTDLGKWEQTGGRWEVQGATAVSPRGGQRKALTSPEEHTSFAMQATVTGTPPPNWFGIATFWQDANSFLLFMVQGTRIMIKPNAIHEPENVQPPKRHVDMSQAMNFYFLQDGDTFRFAVIQPGPAGVAAYYRTDHLASRSGRVALMVRDGDYSAKFTNICLVPI